MGGADSLHGVKGTSWSRIPVGGVNKRWNIVRIAIKRRNNAIIDWNKGIDVAGASQCLKVNFVKKGKF